MQTRTYDIQGGKVLDTHKGQAVDFPVFETLADARARCGDEADLIELASGAFDVWLQGRVRAMAEAKNEDGSPKHTTQAIREFAASAKYERRKPGMGNGRTAGAKTPEGKAKRAAADTGNALFEACLADEALLKRMVKAKVVDEGAFQVWLAARPQAATSEPAAAGV